MTEPLGDEFIRIHADASTFRAEVEAQVGAAMASVRRQVQATTISTPAVATATRQTAGGVILPTTVRSVQQATQAQTQLATATATSTQQIRRQGQAAAQTAPAMRSLERSVRNQERAVGRATRGLLAANAAATGIFRAVTFASGAFLAGAVAGGVLASAMQELSESTVQAAQTQALIEATGGAARATSAQVEQLATSLQNLTGVDDELIQASANVLLTFKNIQNAGEGVNAVFDRAVKATLDISSVMGTNLRSTAIQVGKALQDPIRGVTALRRSGISLSQSQRDLIKQFVETGQILRAQRLILREIEGQIGGTAEAVGRTLPGQLNILKQRAANALGDYARRMTESEDATALAATASATLAAAWDGLTAAARTLGPVLIGVARGLERAAEAVGGPGTILAAAVAYKSVGVAVRVATTAQTLYTTAAAGSAAATLAAARADAAQAEAALAAAQANNANTAALARKARAAQAAVVTAQGQAAAELSAAAAAQRTLSTISALSAVFAVGAALSGQYGVAIVAAGVALTGLAAKAVAAAAALRASGAAITASGVASAALGGPIGIAALSVGALAAGFIVLQRRARNAVGSVHALRDALRELNDATRRGQQGREAVAAQIERVNEAVLDERDAVRALTRAREQFNQTQADPGSVEFLALQDKLAVAQDRLTAATNDRQAAQRRLGVLEAQSDERQRQRASLIFNTNRRLQEQIDSFRLTGIQLKLAAEHPGWRLAQRNMEAFRERMQGLVESGDPLEQKVGRALLGITAALGRLPTRREVEVAINVVGVGGSLSKVFADLEIGLSKAQAAAQQGIEDVRTERNRLVVDENLALQEQRRALRGQLQIQQQIVAEKQEAFNKSRQETLQAQENLRVAKETLRTARQALADARQALVDTISGSRDAITDAVNAAKQNLRSIGDAVADALGRMSEASSVITPALARRFRELRAIIRRGEGGPETRRAAAQVQALAEANRGEPTDNTDRVKRQLGDLSDALNRGRLTLPRFNEQLTKILRGAQFDPGEFRRRFGSAATNEITELIADLRRQAALIVGGPQRAGGGTRTSLVNPLETVAQTNREIAEAQRNVAERVRDVRLAQQRANAARRDYERADKVEQRKHTTLLEALDRKMAINNRLMKVPTGNRAKPGGGAARDSRVATTVISGGSLTPAEIQRRIREAVGG